MAGGVSSPALACGRSRLAAGHPPLPRCSALAGPREPHLLVVALLQGLPSKRLGRGPTGDLRSLMGLGDVKTG